MTKIFNFALKIMGGGREGGTCEVLRPCHPPSTKNLERAPVSTFFFSFRSDQSSEVKFYDDVKAVHY